MKRVKDLIWSGGASRVWDKWPADGTVTLRLWKYKRLAAHAGRKNWLKNNNGVIMVRIDAEFRRAVECSHGTQNTPSSALWSQFTGQVTKMVFCATGTPHIIYFQRCHVLTTQVIFLIPTFTCCQLPVWYALTCLLRRQQQQQQQHGAALTTMHLKQGS